MTVIEFFDRTPIENMVSCLTLFPDKIIFIGNGKEMKRQKAVYENFIARKGLKTTISCYSVNKNELNSIVTVLSQIIENEDDCIFDLTGGDGLILVAMGIVYQKFGSTKRLKMHKFNIKSGKIIDCDNDGEVLYSGTPKISVEDNILLYGGSVESFVNPNENKDWELIKSFTMDIDNLWNVCKENPSDWNTAINYLAEFEKHRYAMLEDGLVTTLYRTDLNEAVSNVSDKLVYVLKLLLKLEKLGLVKDCEFTPEFITYTYKNYRIRRLLSKSGSVLELKVMSIAQNLKNDDGTLFYNDVANGIYIDWDGKFSPQANTFNEIDVMLMHGLVPVFISCKNGAVTDEELYKLNTVAERFGGKYAKKVLIATNTGKSENSLQYFSQRAKDMGIIFINNFHKLSEERAKEYIKNLSL